MMNQSEPETSATKRRLLNMPNFILTMTGVLVFAGYCYLLQSMPSLDMGSYQFQFFPIPRFTMIGEPLFLMLLVGVGVWHVKLAMEKPEDPSKSNRYGKLGQLVFGLLLLTIPLIFRACANLLIHLING